MLGLFAGIEQFFVVALFREYLLPLFHHLPTHTVCRGERSSEPASHRQLLSNLVNFYFPHRFGRSCLAFKISISYFLFSRCCFYFLLLLAVFFDASNECSEPYRERYSIFIHVSLSPTYYKYTHPPSLLRVKSWQNLTRAYVSPTTKRANPSSGNWLLRSHVKTRICRFFSSVCFGQ